MSPVMFMPNPDLSLAIDLPSPLPIDDLRGEPIYHLGKLIGWSELSGGDAVGGGVLPAGFWDCDWKNGKGVRVPKYVHQPTGSKISYAKIEHRELGRIWVVFDFRDGPEWLESLKFSIGM